MAVGLQHHAGDFHEIRVVLDQQDVRHDSPPGVKLQSKFNRSPGGKQSQTGVEFR
jgi:hypothetical protein